MKTRLFLAKERPRNLGNPFKQKIGKFIICDSDVLTGDDDTTWFELPGIKTLEGAEKAAIAANSYVEALQAVSQAVEMIERAQSKAVMAVKD